MAFLGMNADEVEQLGNQMKNNLASEIQSVITQMNGIVGKLPGVWQGADSSRFVNEWPQHKAHLNGVMQELQNFGSRAVAEAAQQRQASQ